MQQSLWTVLLVFGTATWASAAPFNPQHIAADASWVMHVDMEAMHATAAGKLCREKWLKRDEVQRHLDKVRDEIGIDPSEDLLGATMYDTQFKREHGVAMIHMRQVDASRLVAKLNEKEPDNRMMEYKKHELYLWSKHHRGKKMTVCGTLYGNRVMIFSRDPLKVIVALDVLEGRSRGLSDDSRLGGDVRPGTVVLIRGVDLADSDLKTKCPVLKESTWMEVAMGASEGTSFATMVVDTDSAETAENAVAVMDGFAALARLRHASHATFGRMISGLESTASGATISVNWSADEADVMKTIEQVHHKMQEHRQRWREKHESQSHNGRHE